MINCASMQPGEGECGCIEAIVRHGSEDYNGKMLQNLSDMKTRHIITRIK